MVLELAVLALSAALFALGHYWAFVPLAATVSYVVAAKQVTSRYRLWPLVGSAFGAFVGVGLVELLSTAGLALAAGVLVGATIVLGTRPAFVGRPVLPVLALMLLAAVFLLPAHASSIVVGRLSLYNAAGHRLGSCRVLRFGHAVAPAPLAGTREARLCTSGGGYEVIFQASYVLGSSGHVRVTQRFVRRVAAQSSSPPSPGPGGSVYRRERLVWSPPDYGRRLSVG
jgi:hypothetical protein